MYRASGIVLDIVCAMFTKNLEYQCDLKAFGYMRQQRLTKMNEIWGLVCSLFSSAQVIARRNSFRRSKLEPAAPGIFTPMKLHGSQTGSWDDEKSRCHRMQLPGCARNHRKLKQVGHKNSMRITAGPAVRKTFSAVQYWRCIVGGAIVGGHNRRKL